MKSIGLFLIISIHFCRGQYSNGFNHRPSLHGVATQDNLNDTNSDNYQDRIPPPRSQTGARMSRLHESLLRARMRQLSTQGLSKEQMKTEISLKHELTKLQERPHWARCYNCEDTPESSIYLSSGSSGYTSSQVHYLQRTVRRLTLSVNKMEVKVDKFEKWKTTSEERMSGLEKLIEGLLNKNAAKSLETDAPTREEFESLKQQTHENAATITNITEELKEHNFVVTKQEDTNGEIQYKENQEPLSSLRTSPKKFTTLSKKVHELNDTVLVQKKIVERLYARVGKAQKCCRINTYFARRLGVHEKKINEARDKSNNALKYLRIENSRIRSINSKLEDQKQKIEALQDDVISYNAIASQASQRMIGEMESTIQRVNETIRSVTGTEEGSLTQNFKALETLVAENSQTISSFARYAGEQINQINTLTANVADLKSSNDATKREWTGNISRIERRVQRNKEQAGNLRVNMRKLRQNLRHTNASVGTNSNILNQLSRERTNLMKKLHEEITEVHNSSDFLKEQIKNMQTQDENAKEFELQTKEQLQTITETMKSYKVRNEEMESNLTKQLQESETQITTNLETFRNDINATVHVIRAENEKSSKQFQKNNEESEVKINELERKMAKSNDEMVQLTDSLNELANNATKRSAGIDAKLSEEYEKMWTLVDNLAQNFTESERKLEHIEASKRENTEQWTREFFLVNQTLENVRLSLKDRQNAVEIVDIKKKIAQVSEMNRNNSEKMNIQELEITETKRKIDLIRIDVAKLSDQNKNTTSHLANATTSLKTHILQVTAKLEDINDNKDIQIAEAEQSINDLRRSNKTLYDKLESHVREMNAVKDSMTSLQEKEDSVSEAISSFGSVIAEHDFVQRNLTSVSDKVKETLQGQGLALKSIHEIMQQLNVSLIESQDSIDRSYFEQLQTQDSDIRAMRGLMQNFSSLMTKVFNDQLSHDVAHARISERQRTLVEKVDSCGADIEGVMKTSKNNSDTIQSVKSNVMSNMNKITALTTKTDNHSKKLGQVDKNTRDILSLGEKLNLTKANMESNITHMFEMLAEVEKVQNSDQEKQVKLAQDIEDLKHEATKQKDSAFEIGIKQLAMEVNISGLVEYKEITTSLLSRMAETENGVKFVEKDLSEMKNEISTLTHDGNSTKTELKILKHHAQVIQTRTSEQRILITNLSSCVSELQQKQSSVNASLIEVLSEIKEAKEDVQTATTEIQDQGEKLEMLNTTLLSQNVTLEELISMTKSVSSTLKSLHTSNTDVIALTRTMREDLIKQNERIVEINRKTSDTESKFIVVDATINKSSLEQALQKTKTLDKEVSEIKDNLWYIADDMEVNFNSTKQILEQIYDHDERIALLNGETSAVISSLTSSVASLDSSLQFVNESMSFDINDLKELITDFQDAYDTSNRQRARHREEFEVLSSNTSNQFNHISTSIDYITQIVKESNKAVDENRDRLDALNETMVFVRLSIPALLAPGVEDGFFEIEESSQENPLFSFTDLPDAALHQESSPEEENNKGSNNKGNDFRRNGILNDESDNLLTDSQIASWVTDDTEYSENYDFGSLERRKRMVKEVRRIDHKMSDVLEMIESLQTNVYKIGNETESLVDSTTAQTETATTVAFSVGLTQRFACCGTVVFDLIFSNSGSGYDASTGKFTAVKNGLYAFFMAVTERNSSVYAAIVWNNMPQITLRMDHSSGNYEQSQSANAVLLELKAGDQVWLQTYAGSLLGYQHPAVTLTGFLVV